MSVALVIQHAKRMRCIYGHLASPAPPHFSTLSHKRHDFRGKGTGDKMCVLVLPTNLFETFLVLRRIQRDVVTNVHTSSRKVSVILVMFN